MRSLHERLPLFNASSRLVGLAFAALTLGLVADLAHALLGLGGRGLDGFFGDDVYTAIELGAVLTCAARAARRRPDRAAWWLIAAGLLTWAIGDLIWTIWLGSLAQAPYPSVADAFYLATYPLTYAGLVLLMRSQLRHLGAALWLDGAVVGLTLAAIEAALLLPNVLPLGAANPSATAVNMAYPLGDFLLLVIVVVAFALSAWRPGRQWTALGLAIALSAAADLVYLYQQANGAYVAGGLLDVLWPASMVAFAAAAWQPPPARVRSGLVDRHSVALPATAGLAALTLLVVGDLMHVATLAVAFAAAALVLAGARIAVSYSEHSRLLSSSAVAAVTDGLTGVGNRRRLMQDLDVAVQRALAGRPTTLVFFDLNGFKRYNDSFGHAMGDLLLSRLATTLQAAVGPAGTAYRLGGDEFCVLVDGARDRDDRAVMAAAAALTQQAQGFSVAPSWGLVVLPTEARDAASALRLADQRMYAHKATSERDQAESSMRIARLDRDAAGRGALVDLAVGL